CVGVFEKRKYDRYLREGIRVRCKVLHKRKKYGYKRTYYYALVRFEAEGKTIEQEISCTASIEKDIKEEMRLVYLPGEPEKALFEVFLENGGGTTSTIVAAILIMMLSLWMMFFGK
ncbi:MAG: hypothetical protein IKM38_06965, partial [Christensenellaceae bacterium]|nr:hypothetical protein [Christensenellaceae bacterium]